MKIGYIANIRFPSERANAVQVVAMCQAFSAIGHDVALIVSTRKTHITDNPATFYGQPLQFAVMRSFLPSFVTWGKWWFVLASLVFAANVLRSVRQHSFDVLYCRNEWIVMFINRFAPRTKIVYESHEARYSWAVRQLVTRGVPIVVISEGIRDYYVAQGVPESQLLVAHDGIGDSFYQPLPETAQVRQRLGIGNDKPVVMYIGGLDAWKGIPTFLTASTLAPELQWVIIGGTQKQISNLAADYEAVTFLGPQPYRDLPQNQQAADVLVIPNTATTAVSAHYTSPLKLFAHMTSGVPLVVSDVPSLRTVLGEQGTYFTPDDAAALAAVVQETLVNRTTAKAQATQLRDLARDYLWDNRAAQIMQFITQSTV